MSSALCRLALVTCLWMSWAAAVQAADPTFTTITVTDMHCEACAKRIAAKLYRVPGVVQVRADVAKNLAIVVPQQQRQPSPRAVWEAVEQAGFQPVKLTSPTGSFTTKPRT